VVLTVLAPVAQGAQDVVQHVQVVAKKIVVMGVGIGVKVLAETAVNMDVTAVLVVVMVLVGIFVKMIVQMLAGVVVLFLLNNIKLFN